jgi:hypothetical protein
MTRRRESVRKKTVVTAITDIETAQTPEGQTESAARLDAWQRLTQRCRIVVLSYEQRWPWQKQKSRKTWRRLQPVAGNSENAQKSLDLQRDMP